MGILRKLTSVTTLGAVNFRSSKEKTARNTKKAAKEAKVQTKLLQEQNRLLREQQQ
ncbi:hypothetical protein ACIQWA_02725 [Kitasatospora sp. NPDC098652]|uniref:hypothetical protein n=1 Tax=Kitasatospora sp. NPDC098652 TaxID=3364095 RepID=UPI0038249550